MLLWLLHSIISLQSHFFCFQAIDGALDFASKVQQEQADSLRKRKRRDVESVSQPPPPGLLRSLRRKKNEELRATRVIKPAATTPAPSTKRAPFVSPPPTQEQLSVSGSSTDSESVTKSEVHSLTGSIGKLPDFSGELSDSGEISDLDDSIVDKENVMPTTKGQNPKSSAKGAEKPKEPVSDKISDLVAKNKRLRLSLKESKTNYENLQVAMSNQGRELNASNHRNDIVSALFQNNPTISPDAKKEIESMSNEIQRLKKSETLLTDSNTNLILEGTTLQTKVGELEKQLKDSQEEFSAVKSQLEKRIRDYEQQVKTLQDASSFSPGDGQVSRALQDTQSKLQSLKHNYQALQRDRNQFKGKYERYKKNASTLNDKVAVLNNQVGGLEKEVAMLKNSRDILKKKLGRSLNNKSDEEEKLCIELDDKDKEIVDLKASIQMLTTQLDQSQKALIACGGKSPHEVSKTVVTHICNYALKIGYNDTKFVETSAKIQAWCQEVYDAIKGDMGFEQTGSNTDRHLPFDQFMRIYKASCIQALNKRRQYTQTQCLEAVTGTFPESHVIPLSSYCNSPLFPFPTTY